MEEYDWFTEQLNTRISGCSTATFTPCTAICGEMVKITLHLSAMASCVSTKK